MNEPSVSRPVCGWARRVQGVIVAGCLTLASCGGGTELLFVPFFSFGFTGTVNDATLSMFLKPSDDCSTEGVLPESANMSVQDDGSSNITGTYEERKVTITLATPPAGFATTYDGEFQDRDTIAFTPRGTGTAFTVRRNDVGVSLPTCPE